MAPCVSVLLPVFNGATTLRRAVASIRTQTFADWELVIVDDGSTDQTCAELTALAREEPRIRPIMREHEGLAAALNAGLAACRGEFIARMDADDESHPERLDEQRALLRARPHLGLVGCLVEFGGDRGANAGYALHVDWINSLVTQEEIALHRFIESPLAHPSVMFRRELVARLGGYGAGDFPEDYELWLRWLDAGVRMAKVPRVLLTWHDTATRLSRTDERYAPEAFFRMKAEWIAREVRRLEGRRGPSPPSALCPPERRVEAERSLVVWGAGRPTRKRAAHLERYGLAIAGYIDVDVKKIGRAVGGVPIISPAELPGPGKIFVLAYVSSRGARELIRGELRARGYAEGRDFLMCA